ncbi:hypothetical protein ABH931_005820 [Streptacidiphilus sp. MAP12-33]|uniref:hypothetical protein n=1 Tax=Streptacidiphilus sp. MAP12-33 TaxID=3156266 RepID=UPI003511D4F3
MSPELRAERPIQEWRPRQAGNVDLGTRLVCTRLQVDHPRRLPGAGTATIHGAVADQLAFEARRLDDVQARIVQLATALRGDLQRIVEGHEADLPAINGVLHNTAPAIDLLAARRTELHRSVASLIEVYETLPPFAPAPAPAPAAAAKTTRQRAASTRARRSPGEAAASATAAPANAARPRSR